MTPERARTDQALYVVSQTVGEPLQGFTLPALGRDEVSLERVLESKRGAVVVFWSGVCSHCRRYDGYLNDFAARYKALALLVIASRQDEAAEALERTVDDRHLTFDILLDGERRVAHDWLVEQTPRAFLIDDQRRLLYRGAIDNFKYPEDPDYLPYLEPAVADFLAGRQVERSETASFGCPVESVYYDLPKPLRS